LGFWRWPGEAIQKGRCRHKGPEGESRNLRRSRFEPQFWQACPGSKDRRGHALKSPSFSFIRAEFIFKRATTPAALRAAGCGGTALHQFHRWQICRSLGSVLWPFPDVYGPVWGWLEPVKG
jgi:hypothetical protein